MSRDYTRLEIDHVLFIDIVGYSKLLINQQSEQLRELNGLVGSANHFASLNNQYSVIWPPAWLPLPAARPMSDKVAFI
jgi:hypothetical protein